MAKKRGKSEAKPIPKKQAKNAKAPKAAKKTAGKTPEQQKPIKEALRELEILAEEKKVEGKISSVEKEEKEIEQKETQIMAEEKKVEKETEKVEKLEKEIKKEVMQKPLIRFKAKV